MNKKDYFFRAAQIILGIILAGASLYKLASPMEFAHQIYNYKILPLVLINPVAILLPPLQLVCGLSLILNKWEKGAVVWALLMLAVFQVAVGSALIRGLNISCGCFKAGGDSATWWTFGRDFLFLLLAAVSFYGIFRKKGGLKWN